jgi:hypothetical protein
VSAADIRALLLRKIASAGPWCQKAVALDIGISESFLSEVVYGRKPPTGKVLAYLGYEAVPMYRRAPLPEAEVSQ